MKPEYKFKYKYTPQSTRLQNWDYASNGHYFITICTKDRQNYFGEIKNNQIILNEYGKIVYDEIKNINNYNKLIMIDEFIIMPNHIHGILIIDNNTVETSIYGVSNDYENKTIHNKHENISTNEK